MTKTRRIVSPEDSELFRNAVGEVAPVVVDRVESDVPRPEPRALQTERDHIEVLRESLAPADFAELETGEELVYCRPGVTHGALRKLRRGQYSVGAELDLHGCTVAQAHALLTEFLHHCRERGRTCVRIVHGKGHGSPGKKPIIKGKLNVWLRRRDDVVAFCSARPVDGGTGAVYVLLKK